MGAAVSGNNVVFVARRSGGGWSTTSALSRTIRAVNFNVAQLSIVVPSLDLSHTLFQTIASYVATGDPDESTNLYLAGPSPLVEPEWLTRPTIENPSPALGQEEPYASNASGFEPPCVSRRR
jgi:hypothetical protein